MNQLFSIFLKNYDKGNKELWLKAKFVLITTLIVISCLIVTLIYTSFTFGFGSLTVLTELVGFLVMLSALIFLLRGWYTLSVNIIFLTSFTVAWVLMFNEPASSLLIKVDTIVFIIGLMAAMPIMFFRSRTPLVVYFILNLIIFIVFNIHLHHEADLGLRTRVDYFLDNAIAICFVFVVSFNLFTIYRQAMNSLKKELVEKQQARDSLKRMRIMLSNIINSMPSVIIGINQFNRIVIWNDEAKRVTHLSSDEVLDTDVFDMFPQLLTFQDQIKSVKITQTISKIDKQPINYRGRESFVDITLYPLFQDEIEGVVIRIDDITDRLQMEEVMIQSEKMLSIGGLAAGMAHELNNPLAGMMQNAQLIHNRLTCDLPANDQAARDAGISMEGIRSYMGQREILQKLDNISAAGARAAGIVNNMLGFAARSESKKEAVHLPDLLEDAIELAGSDYDLKTKYDFKRIRLERDFESGLPTASCDKSKLQQVVFNLLNNAAQAMSSSEGNDNPRITIRIRSGTGKPISRNPAGGILTGAESGIVPPEMICLEIEDNGPGMDEKTKKRVFEPFYTTKSVDTGTGLGLFVSYFIVVEDHEGTMAVESTVGQGTRFIICLPKA